MSVVNMSSSRPLTDTESEQLSQLAITFSSRLTRAHLGDVATTIAEALAQVAAAIRVDACQLVEFTESGSVARAHTAATAVGAADRRREPSVPDAWLVERLARGELVAISQPDELPREAIAAREQALVTGGCSILAVPGSVAGQTTCAMVIQSRVQRRWAQPLVERLQLLTEILGAALQRLRPEPAHRPSVDVIERLNSRLEADNEYLKEEIKSYHDFDEIVGESPALRLALTRLAQVAPTNSSVLLQGPTGTGKELFARAVHERSRRHARPLVRVNCAALPPTLVESELFGHEKGAFTGAVAVRQGRFELADGGTIFLDEIGDLAPDVQVKFLRVLQEGEFERVGSSRTKKVDVRVIAATHRDLEAEVAKGNFRADLFYRLSVYPINVPSLQERSEDVPQLVWFFIHRHQRDLARRITKVPQSVMDQLKQHSWPGNVRELENVIERAMIASTGDTLQLDDALPISMRGTAPSPAPDNLDAVQRAHIEAILQRCGWRINGTGNAAERLGIHPNTLRFRMKKLGVSAPTGRRSDLRRATMGPSA
jgi:formate hydrogenlyase transcriptional activator